MKYKQTIPRTKAATMQAIRSSQNTTDKVFNKEVKALLVLIDNKHITSLNMIIGLFNSLMESLAKR